MTTSKHHQILIIGGGAAGITVAASLRRKPGGRTLDIAIVEPSEQHYYQPAFTLVGAGVYQLSKTCHEERTLIPPGVTWIHDAAASFDPDGNAVTLAFGDSVTYDYLVVCPGLELNWEKIEGLSATLGSNGVCSNYSPDQAEYTWSCLKGLDTGATVLFTQSPLPFKCPGAPQKIAYLGADHLKGRGILDSCKLHFLTHGAAMFAVPLFAAELDKVAARWGIDVHFQTNLVAVDGNSKTATFDVLSGEHEGEQLTMDFDMIHVTPYQSPPDAIKSSPLANEGGYVDVHQHTMQHTRYPNVFSLGDAGSTPNSKTAAAVRKQAPVVVRNLLHLLDGGQLDEGYDGYGSCPLTTAYGKVILAEFIYGGKVTPTFPLDPRKERATMWWVKKTGLPIMYWDYMLKGHEWFFKHDTEYEAPSA
ncbi:MAG: NAD(P)/FAD-dependent oxidoreductase [Gammaproteobacteria bacterium]|nr:MAG: NAD(P)/FAD-dependent oxidoreductase [Gammaproteobacteria bacterium]